MFRDTDRLIVESFGAPFVGGSLTRAAAVVACGSAVGSSSSSVLPSMIPVIPPTTGAVTWYGLISHDGMLWRFI